jgi:hypothetical protein
LPGAQTYQQKFLPVQEMYLYLLTTQSHWTDAEMCVALQNTLSVIQYFAYVSGLDVDILNVTAGRAMTQASYSPFFYRRSSGLIPCYFS